MFMMYFIISASVFWRNYCYNNIHLMLSVTDIGCPCPGSYNMTWKWPSQYSNSKVSNLQPQAFHYYIVLPLSPADPSTPHLSQDYCNKVPQKGRFISSRNLFLTVLGTGSLISGFHQGLVLMKAFWFSDCWLLIIPSWWEWKKEFKSSPVSLL